MTDTVKFDPGIGSLTYNFNEYINGIYSNIMNLHSLNQKRMKFKLCLNKIQEYMKNNIAFYLGCLLWAYYIYYSNLDNPKNLEGNYFLNMSEKLIEQYDYSMQVNFLDNYFDSFERDSAYYGGKKIVIPDNWKKILSAYDEFLHINEGFINTKTTADVKLPENIKNMKLDLSEIENLINTSIQKQDLNVLFDIKKFDL